MFPHAQTSPLLRGLHLEVLPPDDQEEPHCYQHQQAHAQEEHQGYGVLKKDTLHK